MKKKLMWLSDSPMTNTGYATISRNILNGLSKDYDCHFNAHNYSGQPLPPGLTLEDGTRFNFTIHGNGREAYCKDLIMPRLAKQQPEYFGILLDTFMLYPWIMDLNFSPAKSFFYFPSDGGGGLPQGCENVLKHFHGAVAMAKFGQRQAKEVHGLDVDYIPHACDPQIFSPMNPDEKERARRDLEVMGVSGNKVKGFLSGKYVVGVVARNQGRKMLDKTIKSFAKFCRDKPDAVLFFHSDLFDAAGVFDLRQLILRHNLQNRVVFSDIKFYENFEYKEMRKVYGVMDSFFLSTSGEGFGVPIIEAMSCGIPVIATDYTTTPELIIEDGVCGIAVPIACELTGSWAVERALIDEDKAAEALRTLYSDKELGIEYGKVGREKVLKYYSWDVVIPMWKKFLERL